ncbi:MAG: ribbon-helix-helix protein, CopG family [bacterium]
MTTKTVNISLPRELARELDRRAKVEKRSRSEVIRAATQKYLAWWKEWQSLQGYWRGKAAELGIKPGDVNTIIQEHRKQRRGSR